MKRSPKNTKKLLVATVGLATINYVGCGVGTVANLVIAPSCEATGTCDAGEGDTGPSDSGQNDAEVADAGQPDSGKADAASGDGG